MYTKMNETLKILIFYCLKFKTVFNPSKVLVNISKNQPFKKQRKN